MSLFALADSVVRAQVASTAAARALDDAREGTFESVGGGIHPAKRGDAPTPPTPVTTALNKLVEFIPTETITLFWLAVPASQSLATYLDPALVEHKPTRIDWAMLAFLVCLTPVLLLLIYLSGLASQQMPRPAIKDWPWWKAFAATIAFSAWVFAVPGNPFVTNPALLMAVWVGATLVSMILGLLDPIITQPRQTRVRKPQL